MTLDAFRSSKRIGSVAKAENVELIKSGEKDSYLAFSSTFENDTERIRR
jgi:hypothetical protein